MNESKRALVDVAKLLHEAGWYRGEGGAELPLPQTVKDAVTEVERPQSKGVLGRFLEVLGFHAARSPQRPG
jgi:hypothetical protein